MTPSANYRQDFSTHHSLPEAHIEPTTQQLTSSSTMTPSTSYMPNQNTIQVNIPENTRRINRSGPLDMNRATNLPAWFRDEVDEEILIMDSLPS